MNKTKVTLGMIVLLVLLAGFGWIIYNNMPVRQLENQLETNSNSTENQNSTPQIRSENTDDLTYSMQEVQSHASENDCWSAINGEVYDLTSWVSRHPGGAGTILNLCGIDGTDAFNQQHGRSKRAQDSLMLLKIGSLI